jgi:hypothetical protein
MTEFITIQVEEIVSKNDLIESREILERYLPRNGFDGMEAYKYLKGGNTLPNLIEVGNILKKLRQYVYEASPERKETIQEVINRLIEWGLDNKS